MIRWRFHYWAIYWIWSLNNWIKKHSEFKNEDTFLNFKKRLFCSEKMTQKLIQYSISCICKHQFLKYYNFFKMMGLWVDFEYCYAYLIMPILKLGRFLPKLIKRTSRVGPGQGYRITLDMFEFGPNMSGPVRILIRYARGGVVQK